MKKCIKCFWGFIQHSISPLPTIDVYRFLLLCIDGSENLLKATHMVHLKFGEAEAKCHHGTCHHHVSKCRKFIIHRLCWWGCVATPTVTHCPSYGWVVTSMTLLLRFAFTAWCVIILLSWNKIITYFFKNL